MSTKSRNRNSLLSSHNRSSYSNSTTKDEILSMKYSMEKPDLPIYPLSDQNQSHNQSSDSKTHTPQHHNHHHTQPSTQSKEAVYPDFIPWKDHTQLSPDQQEKERSRLNNVSFLNKGYFETPQVANEYYSARNLISATVFLSNENCNNVIKELSTYLTNAYKTRNEIINKIKHDSNHFKIPSRVTLTSNKRDVWLNELANPNVNMSKIGEKIPHGLRNKVLIEAICSRNVPMNRSIWLTKCVLYGELITLRRKHQNRLSITNSSMRMAGTVTEKFEIHWLQEWTQQVTDYILKFSKEMSLVGSIEKKEVYLKKFNFLLNYVKSLYIESLLDKPFFLSLILRFLKDGLPLQPKYLNDLFNATTDSNTTTTNIEKQDTMNNNDGDEEEDEGKVKSSSWLNEIDMNYGQRLTALTLIKIFWNDLIKADYLSKELTESLLLNYFFTDKLSASMKTGVSENLRQKILKLITETIKYLFEFNCNVFIIPTYWILIEDSLVKILLQDTHNVSEAEQKELVKQLELVKYRNESLIMNMKNEAKNDVKLEKSGSSSNLVSPSVTNDNVENDYVFINRNSDDILNIVEKLDNLKLNEEFSKLLKPNRTGNANWKLNLKVVLYWCVSPFRNYRSSTEDILLICNFLKNNISSNLTKADKTELDNEILEIIYHIAEGEFLKFNSLKLYVLINELYQLKLITIASYLRKLIASGIFFSQPGTHQDLENLSPIVRTHLKILENLPVLNNRQCDSILKKWTPSGFNFRGNFTHGQNILRELFIDKIRDNSFTEEPNLKCMTFMNSLNVGLQFLLINWLTTEIKSMVVSASKLIHFTPTVITNLYQFYNHAAGLTVFFKVVLQTILKNDGGMIIFYLDSLFLISKLVVRHFKLIKTISGSQESSCTAYDLFKLIIQVYKDLSNREYDHFRFDLIWSFMDSVTEKASDFKIDNHENETAKPYHSLTTKDNFDSPMHINTIDPSNNHQSQHQHHYETRSSTRYTSTDFRNDLAYLHSSPRRILSMEEIIEERGTLEVDINGLVAQLQFWFNNFQKLSEEQENSLVKIIRNSITSETSSIETVKEFITKSIGNLDNEASEVVRFLKKLVVFDILRIGELIKLLRPVCIEHDDESLIYEILIGQEDIEKQQFSCSQLVLLQINRYFYREKSSHPYMTLVFQGLLKRGSPYSNDFFVKYKYPVLQFLNQVMATNTKVIYRDLIVKLSSEDAIELLNLLLGFSEDKFIRTLHDFENFVKQANEFNLPICQILLSVISKTFNVGTSLDQFIGALLENVKFEFSSSNSFFGELFNYLSWENKLGILEILENKFLTETVVDTNGMEPFINNETLLPPFNDFFKKFTSSSSINIVQNDKSFFPKMCQFIDKLVVLSNLEEDINENVSIIISVFVKLLIIHQGSICELISNGTHDHSVISFVAKLIELLNSNYLNKYNDKLRILLYDLLLLMKITIAQEIHQVPESESTSPKQEVEPTSPQLDTSTTSPATDDQKDISKVEPTATTTTTGTTTTATTTNDKIINSTSSIQMLFDLPEPSKVNPFAAYLDKKLVDCSIMLDNDELNHSGDLYYFNNRDFYLKSTRNETAGLSSFGEDGNLKFRHSQIRDFKFKSFEILEDISHNSLNDGCINLQLFDAYTTRENPP
ncbi:SRB8 Mediator of RNA polymerase II transcription subunit 12 [Candida maltosa Xu316]